MSDVKEVSSEEPQVKVLKSSIDKNLEIILKITAKVHEATMNHPENFAVVFSEAMRVAFPY